MCQWYKLTTVQQRRQWQPFATKSYAGSCSPCHPYMYFLPMSRPDCRFFTLLIYYSPIFYTFFDQYISIDKQVFYLISVEFAVLKQSYRIKLNWIEKVKEIWASSIHSFPPCLIPVFDPGAWLTCNGWYSVVINVFAWMLSVFLRNYYCWFVCFLSGLFNLRGYDILHNVVFYAYAIVTRTSVRLVDYVF